MSNTSNIYDKSIGSRIRSCRKSSSCCTQASLSEYLGIHPDTLRKWERDESVPEMFYIMKMCELFQCDHGFLLCEHDSKYFGSENLSAYLGLSPAAVDRLIFLKKADSPQTDVLSSFIENQSLLVAMSIIVSADYHKDAYSVLNVHEDNHPLADIQAESLISNLKKADYMNLYNELCKFIEK